MIKKTKKIFDITKNDILRLFYLENDKLYYRIKPSKNIKVGTRAGTNNNGYIVIKLKGILVREHQLIYFLYYGNWSEVIDHVNHIKNDNRIENLRPCTIAENLRNSKKNAKNTSGIKGVCWDKASKKWKAQIWKDNINYHVGVYSNKEDAERAIKEARLKIHGEFCHHG